MVERRQELPPVTSHATACFLVCGDEVILGLKKRSFGRGYLMPVGGKIEEGESSEDCVVREVTEELGVVPKNPVKVGSIDFYYPPGSVFTSQRVDFYVAEFSGQPIETDEMAPERFTKSNVPYEKMLPTNKMFVPLMLEGGTVNGYVVFNDQMELEDSHLKYSIGL